MPKPEDCTPGNCLEDSFMCLLEKVYDKPGAPCKLVHGYPRLTQPDRGYPKGTLYGHAWLERRAVPSDYGPGKLPQTYQALGPVVCIDVYRGLPCPQVMYYYVGRIDPQWCAYYTLAQAKRALAEAGNWGHWHPGPPGAVWGD